MRVVLADFATDRLTREASAPQRADRTARCIVMRIIRSIGPRGPQMRDHTSQFGPGRAGAR